AHAHGGIKRCEFSQSICAKHFRGVRGFDRKHRGFGLYQKRSHVSEIKLVMRIVSLQTIEMSKERPASEGINSGVNFTDSLLRFGKRFLLHDRFYTITSGAGANHSAIAEGISRLSREDRHGGLLCQVEVTHAGNGFRANQRDIAG